MKRHSLAIRLVRTVLFFAIFSLTLTITGLMPMGCGGTNKTLDEAEFYLDQCNAANEPSLTSSCTPALDAATNILDSDPTNAQAALISSSASIGLARLDLLSFMSDLSTLGDSNSGAYSQFRTFISTFESTTLGGSYQIDLEALQNAKGVLNTLLDSTTVELDGAGVATDPLLKRASFQLGLLQALDAYIRPVKLATVAGESHISDIDAVTEGPRIIADYIHADNNLIQGGLSGERANDILTPLRENFCRCSLQTGGFTLSCIRDLMRCEIYASLTHAITTENDYNNDSDFDNLDCIQLLTPSGLEGCSADDTQ
ncbi:MAG: hypothetical protein IPJ69_05285 [Deltaproteobacteria bacterium]|nr:MAG: hypothetical protein IPJ69_05285 [Deltaproteobacteria bacterium]